MVVASCPGRICLAGEHLDWMCHGESVTTAIDARTTVTYRPVPGSPRLSISTGEPFDMRDDVVAGSRIPYRQDALDYVRAAVNVVSSRTRPVCGGSLAVSTAIPVSKGVSSSAALTLSVVAALCGASGDGVDTDGVISMAQEAEASELRTGAGGMDFLACAHGGLARIDTRNSVSTGLRADVSGAVLLLVDAGVKRSSTKRMIERLGERHARGDPGLRRYEEDTRVVVTRLGALLDGAHADVEETGRLISSAHALQRDLLECSTPEIEQIVRSAAATGAFGAKMLGSGAGGCVLVLAAPERVESISDRIGGNGHAVRQVAAARSGLRVHDGESGGSRPS